MMRMEKRSACSWQVSLTVSFCSIAAALAVSAVFLKCMGIAPAEAFYEMAFSAFGDGYGLSETLTKAIPLVISAVALILCYRMLVWNIGAEGQIMAGALAATAMVRWFPSDSAFVMLALMILAAILAGTFWALISGFMRARWNVNEIITTLMLNYIAVNLKNFFVYGPWRDPTALGFPMTAPFPGSAILSEIGFGRVYSAVWLIIAFPILAWWTLSYTRWGYEIRVVGENPRAARFAGINDMKNLLLVMLVSGGLCGLCGFVEMAGIQHRLQAGYSTAYGFTAVIVAWLSNLNPLLTPFVAMLMGGLLVGGESLQIVMGLPVAGVQIIQGFILLFVIAGEFFKRYRMVLRREAR